MLEPLDRQPPQKLDVVIERAAELAALERRRRATAAKERRRKRAVSEDQLDDLVDQKYSIDPDGYRSVRSSGAYSTVNTMKQTNDRSYRYCYWQWREGDPWHNKYIGPVDAEHDS